MPDFRRNSRANQPSCKPLLFPGILGRSRFCVAPARPLLRLRLAHAFQGFARILPATAWVAFKMWTLEFCDRAPSLYRRFSISIRRWAACGSDCSLSHLSASIRQQFSWTDSDSDSYGILVATVRALFAPSAANLKFVRALDHAAATAFERSALIDDSITLTHAISTPALGRGVPAPFIVTCAATQLKSCGVGQAASSLLPSWL